jgi:hypothetical protein
LGRFAISQIPRTLHGPRAESAESEPVGPGGPCDGRRQGRACCRLRVRRRPSPRPARALSVGFCSGRRRRDRAFFFLRHGRARLGDSDPTPRQSNHGVRIAVFNPKTAAASCPGRSGNDYPTTSARSKRLARGKTANSWFVNYIGHPIHGAASGACGSSTMRRDAGPRDRDVARVLASRGRAAAWPPATACNSNSDPAERSLDRERRSSSRHDRLGRPCRDARRRDGGSPSLKMRGQILRPMVERTGEPDSSAEPCASSSRRAG